MIRDSSQAQTLIAKRQFECEMNKHNVRVQSCRADNGRFAEKAFKDEVAKSNQIITYCGVGAHHQNGSIEHYIGKITTRSRVMLLHAKRFWPEAITPMLWPFAVSTAINLENELSLDANGRSPLQRLTATDSPIKLRDYHTWGCPVYVLESSVQSTLKGLPKWEPRARIGIYLGRSP